MTAGSYAHIRLMARMVGGGRPDESVPGGKYFRALFTVALASCVLLAPQVCPGGMYKGELCDTAFEAAGNVTVAASRPRTGDVRDWLDAHDYTADELLMFQKMPVVISGGWRRPTWWPGPQSSGSGRGKGLALSGRLVRRNNFAAVFGEGVVRYSACYGWCVDRYGADRGRRAREWSGPNDFV